MAIQQVMNRVFLYTSLTMALLSCAYVPTVQTQNMESIDLAKKNEQDNQLQASENLLHLQQWSKAEESFRKFLEANPYSVFLQRARFGLAQSLEGQGHWSEAAEVYRTIIKTAQTINPDIAAQAHFAISFCYENMGDEPKVLSSLVDAQNLQQHLDPSVARVEIPARMAASYYRIGRDKEAESLLKKADDSIKQLRAGKIEEGDTAWLARIYYKMGVFSTNQLSEENLDTSLDTLKVVQIFSLRSAEEAVNPWSTYSSDRLIENYQSIWRVIRSLPMDSTIEAGMAKYQLEEKQILLTGKMLELINDLKLHRLPGGSSKSAATIKIYAFVDELKKQAQVFIASKSIRNHLTPEAESLGGLKR